MRSLYKVLICFKFRIIFNEIIWPITIIYLVYIMNGIDILLLDLKESKSCSKFYLALSYCEQILLKLTSNAVSEMSIKIFHAKLGMI